MQIPVEVEQTPAPHVISIIIFRARKVVIIQTSAELKQSRTAVQLTGAPLCAALRSVIANDFGPLYIGEGIFPISDKKNSIYGYNVVKFCRHKIDV